MKIDKTAIVDAKAEISPEVEIGPYSIIEPDVIIGEGTVIHPHVVIRKNTIIGKKCEVYSGAVLGGEPQDTKFKGERSYLKIGDGTVIRESVTAHRASGEETETVIGSNCMLMATTHVAHNCKVGDRVVMANLATLGGFVRSAKERSSEALPERINS